MFLSDFSIRRPIATVVLILGVMALGLMALNKLRVNQLPDIENPGLFISIAYPGASPDTVERECVVCMSAPRALRFSECGHSALC